MQQSMTASAAAGERRDVGDLASAIARLLDADLSRPLAFALVAIVYIASRAPFIGISYGTDPDAWRVALTAHWLWDNHELYPSRLPGYPIHELASAAVIGGGYVATNMLTVLVSLAGLWFFAKIVAELNLPNRALLVAGFAFTPLLWINSMTTLDYMWAVTFVLLSYYWLLVERDILAALALGVAVGCRSTSALMIVPFGVYLWRSGRRDEVRHFVVTVVGVALVAYSPFIWEYGPKVLNFYDAPVGWRNVLRLLAKDTLGLFGAIAVLVAAAVSLPRLARLPADFVRDKDVMVWVLAIALVAFSFARLPHEAGYLLALYPFAFLIMGKYFQRVALAVALVAIVLAGFIDLTTPGEEVSLSSLSDARPGKGLILSNRETMLAQKEFVRDIAAYDIPENSVVMLGFIYPQFVVTNRDRLDIGILDVDRSAISQLSDRGKAIDREGNITYVWLLPYGDRARQVGGDNAASFLDFCRPGRTPVQRDDAGAPPDSYCAVGRQFLYTEDAGRSTASLYDYRPALFGAKLIDLGRSPTGGRGTVRTAR